VSSVNTPALSIVKTTRPETKVVDGHAGLSVGNRMITVFPKSSIRYESLGGGKMRCSLPFDLNESAALYAMYVDMCKGCTRAGVLPPTPEEWADPESARSIRLLYTRSTPTA